MKCSTDQAMLSRIPAERLFFWHIQKMSTFVHTHNVPSATQITINNYTIKRLTRTHCNIYTLESHLPEVEKLNEVMGVMSHRAVKNDHLPI